MPRLSLLLIVATLTTLSALGGETLRITLLDQKGEPVKDAVVSLAPVGAVAPVPAPPVDATHQIIQKGQQFIPYVTAIPVGATVEFPNLDSVQHHVYSLSKPKKFELPLYDPGRSESLVFDRPGVVAIGCNIHDWMLSYLVILDTPYFQKTGEDGTAALSAPAGNYQLKVWHPRLPRGHEQALELVSTTAPVSITLRLKPDRRIHRAPPGGSGGYN